MKRLRKVIAILSGVIVVYGYVAVVGESDVTMTRILVGLLFGAAIAGSMIRHPERISRNHVSFAVAPLLAILIGWTAIYDSARVLPTVIWAICFLASQVAFWLSGSSELTAETHHHN